MTLVSGTANITPEEAKVRRQQSKAEIVALLKGIQQPYALGISREIKQAHPDFPYQHIRFALNHLTCSKRYLKATTEATHRTGLDGSTSELSGEHRQNAELKLKPPKKPSKRSASEKPVITPVVTPAASQQTSVKSAVVIRTKRRRSLSLTRKTA